jgi:outer membrane protein OmpA-like peptidoglycan-associated protein
LAAVIPSLAEEPPLPSYLSLPPQVHVKSNLIEEDYGEAEFIIPGQEKHTLIRGRHWSGALEYEGVPGGPDPEVAWIKLKPVLVQGGWKFLDDKPGQAKTARHQKDGHDSWLMFWIQAPDDMRFDVVEAGPLPAAMRLTLKKPEAKPEKVSAENGDFPYLAPMHGASYDGGHQEDGPLIVSIDQGKDAGEKRAVGSGSIFKSYKVPPGLSSGVLFCDVYREALVQAGWTIVHDVPQEELMAHYSRDGRDLWAYLHSAGENFTLQVADEGAEDLAKELDRDCHVALYGINFDFNKATLRPDSEPALDKVLALLQSRPELKLEVQGHTDNVGTDDYNQKLSEARAHTVVDWLTGKGIAAGRLTAHGYGAKMPIADNGSDEGRAKNRRVELKKQGCGK